MALNFAFAIVNLSNGSGQGNWRHPDQVKNGASADQVILDDTPGFYGIQAVTTDGDDLINAGVLKVETVNATFVRVASTHNDDDRTVRVYAMVRVPAWLMYA